MSSQPVEPPPNSPGLQKKKKTGPRVVPTAALMDAFWRNAEEFLSMSMPLTYYPTGHGLEVRLAWTLQYWRGDGLGKRLGVLHAQSMHSAVRLGSPTGHKRPKHGGENNTGSMAIHRVLQNKDLVGVVDEFETDHTAAETLVQALLSNILPMEALKLCLLWLCNRDRVCLDVGARHSLIANPKWKNWCAGRDGCRAARLFHCTDTRLTRSTLARVLAFAPPIAWEGKVCPGSYFADQIVRTYVLQALEAIRRKTKQVEAGQRKATYPLGST